MFEFIPHSKKARRVHVQLSDTVEVEKRKATVMLGRAGSAIRSYHFNIIQVVVIVIRHRHHHRHHHHHFHHHSQQQH